MKHTTVIKNFSGGVDKYEKGSLPIRIPKLNKIRDYNILPDLMGITPLGDGVRFIRTQVPTFPEKIGAIWFNLTTNLLNIFNGTTTVTPSLLSVKVGTFTLNTSTGIQSITGVGFQPDVVFFLGTIDTADVATTNADWEMMFGIGRSSTEGGVVELNSKDGEAAGTNFSRSFHYNGNECILLATPGSATIEALANIDTLDSDGFSIKTKFNLLVS